ncbi:MAG: hypothetical protein H6625_00810 [Bdellovibrionaceae bacterium]|nr:hypothetical protein [Pseudobdellovibrionaceae bacterium]
MKRGLLIFSFSFLLVSVSASTVSAKNLPQKLPVKRGPASFTQGFKILSKKCQFHAEPKRTSKEVFQVEAGRKIWFTAVDSQWLIAKTKNEALKVYLPSSCVN